MGMRGPLVGYSDGEEDEEDEDPAAVSDDGEASTVAGEAGTTSPPSFS